MPLFVSNTLMRAVKLSNSLPLPSGTNNGTFNLAVLSDINKHSHKGSRRVPETPRAVHKQEKRKKDDTHTNTTLNTHREEEKKEKKTETDLLFLIMEFLMLTSVLWLPIEASVAQSL